MEESIPLIYPLLWHTCQVSHCHNQDAINKCVWQGNILTSMLFAIIRANSAQRFPCSTTVLCGSLQKFGHFLSRREEGRRFNDTIIVSVGQTT